MTITDVGILLIVLCVLAWAVMAALHRHTVQLSALHKQLDSLKAELHAQSGRQGGPEGFDTPRSPEPVHEGSPEEAHKPRSTET